MAVDIFQSNMVPVVEHAASHSLHITWCLKHRNCRMSTFQFETCMVAGGGVVSQDLPPSLITSARTAEGKSDLLAYIARLREEFRTHNPDGIFTPRRRFGTAPAVSSASANHRCITPAKGAICPCLWQRARCTAIL